MRGPSASFLRRGLAVAALISLVSILSSGSQTARAQGNPFQAILTRLDAILAQLAAGDLALADLAADVADIADGITDVDDKLEDLIGGAEAPWQRSLGFVLPVGGGPPAPPFEFSSTYTVPADKRLVIEYVSTAVRHDPNQASMEMYEFPPQFDTTLVTTVGGFTATHHFPLSDANRHQGANFNGAEWHFANPVRIYADPGSTVSFELWRSSNGFGGDARMTLSGRLVDP